MTKNTSRKPRPIRFEKLYPGSHFRIFAEPSRSIRRSTDQAVYKKECEAYSVDTSNTERAIILYPEDLVMPLTRGGKR